MNEEGIVWSDKGTIGTVSQTSPVISGNTIGEPFILIPQEFEEGSEALITLDVVADGKSVKLHIPLEENTFAMGHTCTFVLNYNGHEGIQLWANGPYWASCNIGATKEYEEGDLFAWGETYTKSDFSYSNYTYRQNPTTLPEDADAAHVAIEGNWRMPTRNEYKELYNNTTASIVTLNGIKCVKLMSKKSGYTSNYIILPIIHGRGEWWTSTRYSSSEAWIVMAQEVGAFEWDANSSDDRDLFRGYREDGYMIRPVQSK